MSELYHNFHKYFEIVIADTPELLEQVYRIRYQRICIDMAMPGYEPKLYPNKLEIDEYDSHSAHILVRYRITREFIGTVRLILADSQNPDGLFPVERYMQIDPKLFDRGKFLRHYTGEISRLIVVKSFHRRRQERRKDSINSMHSAQLSQDRRACRGIDRRSINNLTLVLMAGVVRLCAKHNIRNWFTIMDPALNRLFGYYGMDLQPIGPLMDHNGLRRPYFVSLVNVVEKMRCFHHDAWEIVTERGKYCHFLSLPISDACNVSLELDT